MKKALGLSIAAFIVLLVGVFSSNAAVFLSNVPFPIDGGPCLGDKGNNVAGVEFTTGASDTTLGYVSVLLHEIGDPVPVTLSIYSDNAGLPGTSLSTLGTQTTTGGGAVYSTYTYPAGDFSLSANTNYWIVASSTASHPCFVGWGRTTAIPTGTFTYVTTKQRFSGTWDTFPTALSIELGEEVPVTYAPGEDVQFNPTDGRINRTTRDRSAPVAIYCMPHGIQVRLIDPATGVGIDPPAINLFTEDIEAAGVPTEENLLLAENEGVSLYRLTTGEFQVNVLDANNLEYKWFVFVWDQCPVPTNSYHIDLKG